MSPVSDRSVQSERAAYFPHALGQLPRLLSCGDREPFSLTYGCFDRSFWAWKFTDFAGARFQEAAYTLAHLYRSDRNNPLRAHAKALDWTRAIMAYWRTLQHRDGSFDEAYPFEHSLAATAFTGFYVGEAFELIADELSEQNALSAPALRARRRLAVPQRRTPRRAVEPSRRGRGRAHRDRAHHRRTPLRRARRQFLCSRIYDRQSRGRLVRRVRRCRSRLPDPRHVLSRAHLATHTRRDVARQPRPLGRRFSSTSSIRTARSAASTARATPNSTFRRASKCSRPPAPTPASIARFMRPSVAQGARRSCHDGPLQSPADAQQLPLRRHGLRRAPTPASATALLPCEQEGEWHFPDAGLFGARDRDLLRRDRPLEGRRDQALRPPHGPLGRERLRLLGAARRPSHRLQPEPDTADALPQETATGSNSTRSSCR